MKALAPLTSNINETIEMTRNIPQMLDLLASLEDVLKSTEVQEILSKYSHHRRILSYSSFVNSCNSSRNLSVNVSFLLQCIFNLEILGNSHVNMGILF